MGPAIHGPRALVPERYSRILIRMTRDFSRFFLAAAMLIPAGPSRAGDWPPSDAELAAVRVYAPRTAVPPQGSRADDVGACRPALDSLGATGVAPREAALACMKAAFALHMSPGQAVGAENSTNEDRRVLDIYVDHFAYLINKALRTGDKDYLEKKAEYIRTLGRALDRLPAFHGVVYRGSLFPPLVGAATVPGLIFVDPAFVSTSQSLDVADGYTGVDGYLYVILGSSGRVLGYGKSIDELSVEEEVLFKTGTRFEVLAVVAEPKERRTLVFMAEVP